MRRKKQSEEPSCDSLATPRRALLSVGLAVITIGSIAVLGPARLPAGEPQASPAASPSATAEGNRLVGRWVRPDGGYVLEIRSAAGDGTVDAGYFNPRPIHVAISRWQRKGAALQLFVELRDENYPGSTYTLELNDAGDRLSGVYFQAVERTNFDVTFERRQ